jgi:glutaredoxin 3
VLTCPGTISQSRSEVGDAGAVAGTDKAILCKVMSGITVYTTDPCSFCRRVKELLRSHGVDFEEVNLAKDAQGRADLARRTGMLSFPQVVLDGELLGGFAEVQAAADSGRLKALLAVQRHPAPADAA